VAEYPSRPLGSGATHERAKKRVAMFIRTRERMADMWHRFRPPEEGFVFNERDGLFEARIVPKATRAIDLFLLLSFHLDSTVRVAVEDVRRGRTWHADSVALTYAREAMAGVGSLLLTHAGVEVAMLDTVNQVTLTSQLEIFVYSRTERWFYFLRDLGIRQYRSLESRSWTLQRAEFPTALELSTAVDAMVKRLELRPG